MTNKVFHLDFSGMGDHDVWRVYHHNMGAMQRALNEKRYLAANLHKELSKVALDVWWDRCEKHLELFQPK